MCAPQLVQGVLCLLLEDRWGTVQHARPLPLWGEIASDDGWMESCDICCVNRADFPKTVFSKMYAILFWIHFSHLIG